MPNLDKNMVVAVDETKNITTVGASTEDVLEVYRGTAYLVKITLSNSVADSNAYSLSNSYSYAAYVGDIYGSNVSPVLSYTDPNVWNNVSNWSNVSPSTGTLCLVMNTVSTTLAVDLANVAAKEYCMQIVCNASGNLFMLDNSTILVHNIATEV